MARPLITISTHNGSTFSLGHNIRDPHMVEKENQKWQETHPGELRIDPNGEFEIWHYEKLTDVYEKLFGDALREWNQRQDTRGKPERKIDNYLSAIRSKEKQSKNAKHPAYEIIYQVGSLDNPVERTVGKAILEEIGKTFHKRNPHLYPVCIAYHADEMGSGNRAGEAGKLAGHVHVTYVPVATDCARGLRTQNALSSALKQQGIEGAAFRDTPQMAWERAENAELERICNTYGYNVDHPMRGGLQEHLTIEQYKLKKELEETQKVLEKAKTLPLGTTAVKTGRLRQLEDIEKKYLWEKPKIEQAKADIHAAKSAMMAYTESVRKFEQDKANYKKKVNEAANAKLKILKDRAVRFIRVKGLWNQFISWVQECMELEKQETQESELHQ